MSNQRFITLHKPQEQEQPVGELQLSSRALRPSLISGNTMSNMGYGGEIAYNPATLPTIPDFDLSLYDENLQQQHAFGQYNNLETGINGYQQCSTEVDIVNSYLPSPSISYSSSTTEDLGSSGGIVSTWSVHNINSIVGSTPGASQQQYHRHHHQATFSTSGSASSFSTPPWCTPLSPVSNSSIAVCTNWEVPAWMLCSFTPTMIKNDCISTFKVIGYKWNFDDKLHYNAITARVDPLLDDPKNLPPGPFFVARRYVPKSHGIDEIRIDSNDRIMVYRVMEDGWCVGGKCSAPLVCGYFPVGCLLMESLSQLDNTHPHLADIWRRFSDCTRKPPTRKESLVCLACNGNSDFQSRKSLNRHLRTSIKHRPRHRRRQCKACGEWLSRTDAFRRHQRSQHDGTPP
ncbi:hypothetical protein O0I10_009047 [Lichtheimia ornata]|uniref:C2H2-type domain-containing protein n=1 Tax=Lichtheimia ornata TaxID=688661 RepID=A0AAD7XWB2_9FUNG|nr:uncharacterized protein O0I10_009047 [Lichtheimia ornata]KAJ8655358.1 hypothetical protein O0I10_009047 [Lichtheimia ornata]